jgi:hypothetical protein
VPEPGTPALLSTGLLGAGLRVRATAIRPTVVPASAHAAHGACHLAGASPADWESAQAHPLPFASNVARVSLIAPKQLVVLSGTAMSDIDGCRMGVARS